MLTAIILTSLAIGVVLFLLIARPIGLFSYQTFTLAPGFFMGMPIAAYSFHLYYNGMAIVYGPYFLNPATYVFVYLYNLAAILLLLWAMVACYRWSLGRPLDRYVYVDSGSFGYTLAMAFFIAASLGIVAYLHFRFGFAYVADPRRLYELTRQGYGHFYFVMGFTMKIAFVMALFSRYRHPLLLLGLFTLAFLTGSKSNAFVLFLIYVGHRIIFHYRNRVPGRFVALLVAVATALAVALFSMTFRSGVIRSPMGMARLMISFLNEGTNNTVLLMDKYDRVFRQFHAGTIFLEDNVLTRVPRALAPGKPVIFGSFRLADAFFHKETAMGVGAKTFGTQGNFYADFGYWAFLLLLVEGLVFYGAAGLLVARLMKLERPEHGFLPFCLLLFMVNVYFVHVPPGRNLPENVVLVLLIGAFAGFRRISLAPR